MTTLKLNDSVELLKDVPERNLSKGARGTVVFIFSEPRPAYEVEFVAGDGSTIAELALESDAIRGLPSNRSKDRSSGVIGLGGQKISNRRAGPQKFGIVTSGEGIRRIG